MRNGLLWVATALLLSSGCKGDSQDSTADEGESAQPARTTASSQTTKKKGDMYGFLKLCTIATEVEKDESIPKNQKVATLEKRVDDELPKVGPFGRASTSFFATMARSVSPEDAYELVKKGAKDVGIDWQCESYARLRALQPHRPPLPNPDEPAPSGSAGSRAGSTTR